MWQDSCTESRDTKAFLSRKQLYSCRPQLSWVHTLGTEPQTPHGIVFYIFSISLFPIYGKTIMQSDEVVSCYKVVRDGVTYMYIQVALSYYFFFLLREGTLPQLGCIFGFLLLTLS